MERKLAMKGSCSKLVFVDQPANIRDGGWPTRRTFSLDYSTHTISVIRIYVGFFLLLFVNNIAFCYRSFVFL